MIFLKTSYQSQSLRTGYLIWVIIKTNAVAKRIRCWVERCSFEGTFKAVVRAMSLLEVPPGTGKARLHASLRNLAGKTEEATVLERGGPPV